MAYISFSNAAELAKHVDIAYKDGWSHNELSGKRGSPFGCPKVSSLTSKVEATVGEGKEHEELHQLIAEHEQAAKADPSPLEPDPPDGPPRKVAEHQRL